MSTTKDNPKPEQKPAPATEKMGQVRRLGMNSKTGGISCQMPAMGARYGILFQIFPKGKFSGDPIIVMEASDMVVSGLKPDEFCYIKLTDHYSPKMTAGKFNLLTTTKAAPPMKASDPVVKEITVSQDLINQMRLNKLHRDQVEMHKSQDQLKADIGALPSAVANSVKSQLEAQLKQLDENAKSNEKAIKELMSRGTPFGQLVEGLRVTFKKISNRKAKKPATVATEPTPANPPTIIPANKGDDEGWISSWSIGIVVFLMFALIVLGIIMLPGSTKKPAVPMASNGGSSTLSTVIGGTNGLPLYIPGMYLNEVPKSASETPTEGSHLSAVISNASGESNRIVTVNQASDCSTLYVTGNNSVQVFVGQKQKQDQQPACTQPIVVPPVIIDQAPTVEEEAPASQPAHVPSAEDDDVVGYATEVSVEEPVQMAQPVQVVQAVPTSSCFDGNIWVGQNWGSDWGCGGYYYWPNKGTRIVSKYYDNPQHHRDHDQQFNCNNLADLDCHTGGYSQPQYSQPHSGGGYGGDGFGGSGHVRGGGHGGGGNHRHQ